MGCGASSAVQIAPISDTDVIPGNTNDNSEDNSNKNRYLTDNTSAKRNVLNVNGLQTSKHGIKVSNKVQTIAKQNVILVSTSIQTDSYINDFKTQFTQTDIQLSSEDELGLQSDHEFIGDECDRSHDCSDDLDSYVNKSVLLQTEESLFATKCSNSNRPLTLVTIDVGIQVQRFGHTCATQTRLTFANATKNILVPKILTKYTNNRKTPTILRKSASDDIDSHYHLWTASTILAPDVEDINTFDIITTNDSIIDFESQTDPLLPSVLAANSNGSDLTVLPSYDITSPFAHIEKELLQTKNNFLKRKLSDNQSLNNFLDEMDDKFRDRLNSVPKCDASVQTDNDILTDESPEYAARPPPCLKREMISNITMFKDIDKRVLEAPEFETIEELVEYLSKHSKNDLFTVRAIFRWIANNVRFDWKYRGVTMTSNEILKGREGVCKDYCQLFADMCRVAGIRVKNIDGFAKGQDQRTGHQFIPGEDITHTWNAVFILSAWRLIDTTWGTGYTEPSGKFQRKLNEHFFLTDPEVLIWTHFPYNEMENNYCRWQLLDKPLSLEDFNSLPKVSANFFEYNLKIRSKTKNPVVFRIWTEIKIGSHEAMRYKYKLYPSDELENSSLNHYVFCQLKEDRQVGSFAVQPPIEGRFFLKIFAKPERDMQEGQDATSLHNVCTYLLECTRARKYIEPLPINDLPWGPTQTFYDYKLRLHNQTGPSIMTWGGRRRLVMEANETMLMSYSIFDADGMEMDTRSIVTKDDSGNKFTFTINPPRVGTFKLMIFGMPKPKQKGKCRLPLLATFLVDCKLIKPPQYDEDPQPASMGSPAIEELPQRGAKKN